MTKGFRVVIKVTSIPPLLKTKNSGPFHPMFNPPILVGRNELGRFGYGGNSFQKWGKWM